MGAELSNIDAPPPSPPLPDIELPLREFTLEELRKYDGTNPIPELENRKAIYLAINGSVFDVSKGKQYYGIGEAVVVYRAIPIKHITESTVTCRVEAHTIVRTDISLFCWQGCLSRPRNNGV
jgi:predicted heme/steroid binding protein